MRKGEILNLRKDQVNFKDGYILVEGTKNGEVRRAPMNDRLSGVLKKTLAENPTPEHKRAAVKILDGVTTNLTTPSETPNPKFPLKS